MSFILDALKKSESERLRKNAPGIASIPESGRQKSSSRWMWLVLALITVNLVVLAGLLIKVKQETVTAETPAATTIKEARSAAPSLTPIEETVDAVKDEPVVPITTTAETLTSPEISDRTSIAPASAPQPGTVDRGFETFDDLRANGTLALPDMHLDIHVYSGTAEDRFVFVNMSKYKENATLSEGPVVSEITPDGVILSYRGTSFLLPRE